MKCSDLDMRLTVIGAGHLRLTHAACMADLGHKVLAIDVDKNQIAKAAEGAAPFFEPGLELLLRKNLDAGRLRFATSYTEAADFGDVHFLCVGTPQADNGAADLTSAYAAAKTLAPRLTSRCLIVGKSTVPVGAARKLMTLVKARAPAGERVELAWNPEFLREGSAVHDTLHPTRLVFGGEPERGSAGIGGRRHLSAHESLEDGHQQWREDSHPVADRGIPESVLSPLYFARVTTGEQITHPANGQQQDSQANEQANQPFGDVGDHLVQRRRGGKWKQPNISSLSRGRGKLGADPVRMLFEQVAGPTGADGAPGVFCCGLRVVSMDGPVTDVPDSKENDAFFGRPSNQSRDWPGATSKPSSWPTSAPARSTRRAPPPRQA